MSHGFSAAGGAHRDAAGGRAQRAGRVGAVRPDDVDGSFTPGELLALALAACNVMSVDHVLTRRVGEVPLSGSVTTTKDVSENAYTDAHVELAVGGGHDLDDAGWQELVAVASRAVERGCTVGRTLEQPLPHTISIVRTDAKEQPR